mgnify:CR=1 FL=1
MKRNSIFTTSNKDKSHIKEILELTFEKHIELKKCYNEIDSIFRNFQKIAPNIPPTIQNFSTLVEFNIYDIITSFLDLNQNKTSFVEILKVQRKNHFIRKGKILSTENFLENFLHEKLIIFLTSIFEKALDEKLEF